MLLSGESLIYGTSESVIIGLMGDDGRRFVFAGVELSAEMMSEIENSASSDIVLAYTDFTLS